MNEENAPDPKKNEARRVRSRRRARLLTAIPVLGLHLGLFMLLFSTAPRLLPDTPVAEPVVSAELFKPPPPPPPPPPPEPRPAGPPKASSPAPAAPVKSETPRPSKPPPPRHIVKTPPPPEVQPVPAAPPRPPQPNVVLSEAALAGATVAGPGSGGGSGGTGQGGGGSGDCDMVRRLQDALRDDPEVRLAVSQVHRALGPGKAILVWNREWMPSPGQEGKGLARVRQAIAVEVAFAPEACRARPMRGLVVISFADTPGAPKLAMGGGSWRWSELLAARR